MAGPDDANRGSTTVEAAASGLGDQPSSVNNEASIGASPTVYPLAGRRISRSGHTLELNDTPSGERVRLRHRTGSEIDMLPDGSVVIGSRGKMVMTINNDMSVTIHGNLNYQVDGDINMNATGNINMNAVDVNVNTSGDLKQNVGSLRTTARGNVGVIADNVSETILNTKTSTILGDHSLIVDGTNRIVSEGSMQIASGENIKVSAEGNYDASSNSANIAANSMTVIGATGTMGGQGIVHYGKGATFEEGITAQGATFSDGVTASTFHGALEGNAKTATQAGRAGTAGALGAGGSGGSEVNVATPATPTTAKPTSGILSDYLNVSDKGIAQVQIDETEIRRMYRRSDYNGGFSNRELTTNDLRLALRDEKNLENTNLVNNHIAQGTISASSVTPMPTSIGRTSSANQPDQFYGAGATDDTSQPFFSVSGVSSRRTFVPPPNNYITNSTPIDGTTELLPSVRLSSFLRYSSQTTL